MLPPTLLGVKAWEALTEAGKLRRLRPLAMDALTRYPIAPLRLRLVGGFTNAVFRVDTAEATYALRIDYLQDHPDSSTAIELAWLDALARDTELDVCRVVHSGDGASSVCAEGSGVPGARRCTLFGWVPGKPLASALSEARYQTLGRLSAGLHEHGAAFQPPETPMAWDRVFYWPEELDPVVIRASEHAHHFAGNRKALLETAITTVERAFDKLDPAGAQVVHADLHPWNVHVYRNRMIALDFEDVSWAHRVQDVATTLFYERDNAAYPDLRAAFEEGYCSVAPWPASYEGELEHFMAARTIMFINFVLNIDDDPGEYLETAFPRLERFVAAYAS